MFEQSNGLDRGIRDAYLDALKEDYLLLSGSQVSWAEGVLTSEKTADRRHALAILGLSGDARALTFLDSLKLDAWPERERVLFAATKRFLVDQGRDIPVTRIVQNKGLPLNPAELLCYPRLLDSRIIRMVVPKKPSDSDELRFLQGELRENPRTFLSSYVLGLISQYADPGYEYSGVANYLFNQGRTDAALAYGRIGIAKGASAPSLELKVGVALAKAGEWEEAARHFEAGVLGKHTDDSPALEIARLYRDSGKTDQAEDWFRRGLKTLSTSVGDVSPSSVLSAWPSKTLKIWWEYVPALDEFARFLAKERRSDGKRIEEALSLSLESNRLSEESLPNPLDTLAECQALNGDFATAVSTARKALKLVPEAHTTHEYFVRRLKYFEDRLQAQSK
jgi:tetratricopeptide (TPR) repeat protein